MSSSTSAATYAALFAALDAQLGFDVNYVSSLQMQAAGSAATADDACYCGYIDPPPRNCNDTQCNPCEAKKANEKVRRDASMTAEVEAQLALPDGHPKRIFSDAEIRDLAGTHCDSRGFHRTLLQALRKRLGLYGK